MVDKVNQVYALIRNVLSSDWQIISKTESIFSPCLRGHGTISP